jgi:biofilm PGA synthesis N-glycosyltransferase PgaC
MAWLTLILLIPYLYLLMRIYISLGKINAYEPSAASEIFLSVIVACRNEEKNLPSLLPDIAFQDYNPNRFELIIVDDNSDDSTFRIASEFKGIKNIKVLKNSASGKKTAINEGVKASTGDVIVTTDADCRPSRNWLKTISSYWSENKPEMIIGPVSLNGGKGFFQRFQELEFLGLQGVTAGTAVTGDPAMCNGANLIFTRDSYFKNTVNLRFDKVSGDDIFLLHSIKAGSGKILWLESEAASVITGSVQSPGAFLEQRARWISKAGAYIDRYTQLLAIVTFGTILIQVFFLAAGFINPLFFLIFLAALLLKSLPDYLILQNRTLSCKKKNLMWFFLPGELIYPFFVISVVIFYLFTGSRYVQEPDK